MKLVELAIYEKELNIAWVDYKFIEQRIDAQYYKKEFVGNEIKIKQINNLPLKGIYTRGDYGTLPDSADYSQKGIYLIRGTDLRNLSIKEDDLILVPEEYFSDKSEVKSEDILILIKGATIDAEWSVSIVPKINYKAIFNGSIFRIRLKKEYDPYFITAFMSTKYFLNQKKRAISNTGIYYNDKDSIENFIIPIPSPDIQKYIGNKVRKAEELREEAKRLKKEAEEILNRELNLNKLEESLKSSINSKHNWITSMDINDRIDSYYYKRRYILVNQHLNDYECIQIRDIASVDYGYMPTEDYADENNGVPLIRVTNMIGNLLLDLSDLKYISKSINIPDDKYVDDGDILVVQCGNTTGKIALMTKEVENYLYPSFCLRIKLRNKSINNKYLALLMEMSIIQEQIWQSASYSSVRPNTTKPAIENIRIPLIEKQKQEDVGALVEKYIDNIYQSKQLILEAKQDVEDLIEGNFDMSKVKANS